MLSKTFLRSGAAAAFLLGAGLISSAQQPVRPGQAQPPVKIQVGGTQVQVGDAKVGSSATYRAKQILGSKIMIQNNTQIGTVDDILIVANDGKMVTVPWEAAKFNLKSQTGVVNITPDVYKNLPTYTTTTYPDFFAPAYRTTTYKYYGLTPGQLRRLNRIVRP